MRLAPNSPWAALNGDFGLELIGWMSHIAELPGDPFVIAAAYAGLAQVRRTVLEHSAGTTGDAHHES